MPTDQKTQAIRKDIISFDLFFVLLIGKRSHTHPAIDDRKQGLVDGLERNMNRTGRISLDFDFPTDRYSWRLDLSDSNYNRFRQLAWMIKKEIEILLLARWLAMYVGTYFRRSLDLEQFGFGPILFRY